MGQILYKPVSNLKNFSAKLLQKDVSKCVAALPKDIKELLEKDHKYIVAGGFIRSILRDEPINDVDLFIVEPEDEYKATYTNPKVHQEHIDTAKNLNLGAWFFTPNAISFEVPGEVAFAKEGSKMLNKCQIVTRFTSPTVDEVLNKFDFTNSMAAIYCDDQGWTSTIYNNFYNDVCNSILKYNEDNRGEPIITVKRLLKFATKGWQYNIRDLAKLLERVTSHAVDWQSVYKLLTSQNYGAY